MGYGVPVTWDAAGSKPLAFEYIDAHGVLWRAEQGMGDHFWRLTADGVADRTRTWMDLREIRLHVEGEIK